MKFTKTHEWIKTLENNQGVIGISEYAQKELSDIVFVELPKVGNYFKQGEVLLTIESVKAASDIYAPINLEVIEINESLSDNPEKINNSPEDEGWLIKVQIKDPKELDRLLNREAYEKENLS